LSDLETVASTAATIGDWALRLLPDAGRGERLAAALRSSLGQDSTPISAEGCRRIEKVCHAYARHLTVEFNADGSFKPDTDTPTGWPPVDAAAIRRRGAGIAAVSRHGDIGVLRVDALEPWDLAKDYVSCAIGLLRGCRGIVLDNRRNGGGEMDTLAALAGLMLGEPGTVLATVTSHAGVQEWRTPAPFWPEGMGELPAVVLTSARTYSSGEALSYVLQNRGVPVIGQPTPGAADHVVPVRVSRHVEALVPFAVVTDPSTGGNWEGTGVIPDARPLPGLELSAALTALTSKEVR
jgi:hypothetical protein